MVVLVVVIAVAVAALGFGLWHHVSIANLKGEIDDLWAHMFDVHPDYEPTPVPAPAPAPAPVPSEKK